ncbi:MAG: hypothetical protein HQK97_13205, partial [Nitrospirae bacterium]|nr:hypothetical protein [Nitrospirota bacterium]
LKGDVVTAVRRLISGKPYDVSMGRIKTPWGQRYFIEMAGAGLDAAAVYGLNRRIKVYAGAGAYILSGINCIVNESFQRMTVSVNGSVIACNTVILSNGACYGGNIRMAPQADIRQPSLYATVFRYGHRLEMFAAVADVFRGRHASGKSKYVEHIEFREMAIETDSFHIHVDGDYFSRTPAEVDIVERALRLVY